MVITLAVATIAAEKTTLAFAEGNAEIIASRVYGTTHVGDTPATRFGQFGTENVKAAVTGMAVGGKIQYRIGTHIREHLIAGSVYPLAKIFQRTDTLLEVDSPYIAATASAGHVAGKVQPVAVGRNSRMTIAR